MRLRTRTPGPVSFPKSANYFQRGNSVTVGYYGTSTYTSTCARCTQHIAIGAPFVGTGMIWYIRNTGTYDFEFITSLTNATRLFLVQSNIAVNPIGDIAAVSLTDFYLPPGQYYPSMVRQEGAVTPARVVTSLTDFISPTGYPSYIVGIGARDLTATTVIWPIRLVGYFMDFSPGVPAFSVL